MIEGKPQHPVIALEFCGKKTLLDFLMAQPNETNLQPYFKLVKVAFWQLVDTVRYLHEAADMAHNDIKIDNIIIHF